LKKCRNIKLPTRTKAYRNVTFHVAVYYRSDIDDLLNTCITTEGLTSQQKV